MVLYLKLLFAILSILLDIFFAIAFTEDDYSMISYQIVKNHLNHIDPDNPSKKKKKNIYSIQNTFSLYIFTILIFSKVKIF